VSVLLLTPTGECGVDDRSGMKPPLWVGSNLGRLDLRVSAGGGSVVIGGKLSP
jgi:hypothetical protein